MTATLPLFLHDFATSICLEHLPSVAVARGAEAAALSARRCLPDGAQESGQHLVDEGARLVVVLGERGPGDLQEDVGQLGRLVGLRRPPRPWRRGQANPPFRINMIANLVLG